jgi:cytochrome c-type protein NapB
MKRLFIISLFVIIIIAGLAVWNFSYEKSLEEAYVPMRSLEETSTIGSEAGVFKRSEFALEYSNMPLDKEHQRKLADYYDNKSFMGAPPSIPHEVENMTIGSGACLKCHENGGFVKKYQAYAPVTPHPEKISCTQCHVEVKSNGVFVSSSWQGYKGPGIGNSALEGSPPVIPHHVQLRENCLSCHAGPSAVAEIRTTHPERVNCRQCHVVNEQKLERSMTFVRKKIN